MSEAAPALSISNHHEYFWDNAILIPHLAYKCYSDLGLKTGSAQSQTAVLEALSRLRAEVDAIVDKLPSWKALTWRKTIERTSAARVEWLTQYHGRYLIADVAGTEASALRAEETRYTDEREAFAVDVSSRADPYVAHIERLREIRLTSNKGRTAILDAHRVLIGKYRL